MSRGNYFCNNKTKHYFNIPQLNKFGLSYLDAYGYNILRNPDNNVAKRAYRITRHREVKIHDSKVNILKWLQSMYNCQTWEYQEVNPAGDYITSSLTVTAVESLITYVESHTYAEIAADLDSGNSSARKLYDIQTSRRGYLEGSTFGTTTFDEEGETSYSSNKTGIKLFLPAAEANRTDRTAATKSTTKIQGIPRTKAGKPYHFQDSEKSELGNYTDGTSVSSSDPSASVAGQLKKTWNKVENCWDAGGTFIAVLLQDLDGADIKSATLTESNTSGRGEEDFYGSAAADRMFEFTSGLAVPVQLQTSKPQSFGPNIMNCSGTKDLEKIRVVNRTRHNFTQGERVLVHQIDGENIISKFTEETTEQRPPQPGRWNFAKFFSSSDTYFRFKTNSDGYSNRSYYPSDFVKFLYQDHYERASFSLNYYYPNSDSSISEPEYETYDFLNTQSDTELNKHSDGFMGDDYDTFKGLWELYEIKLEDQCDADGQPFFGGPNARINIEADPDGNDVVGEQVVMGRDTSLWFGPMFPNGIGQQATLVEDGYKFDKMQTPASLVYPFQWPCNFAVSQANDNSYITYSTALTTKGILTANNKQRVQFMFAPPELYCCGDNIAQANPKDFGIGKAIGSRGRFGSANANLRDFPYHCQQATVGSKAGKLFRDDCADQFLYPAISRRTGGNDGLDAKAGANFGNGAMAAFCRGLAVPQGLGKQIPFDCYINARPTNSPKNAPVLFGGDTGPEAGVTTPFQGGDTPSQYVGANAVSIMSARFRMNQGSGGSWALNAETNQTFGMKGRFFGGGGGGSIAVTIIGAIMAFTSDNRGKTIQGMVPMWGSNKGDSIDSFGTAACHVQVWDAWPDELTHWIPEYMCALHFNPSLEVTGPLNVNSTSGVVVTNYAYAVKEDQTGNWVEGMEPDEEYEIIIGQDTEVSFRDPTYGDNKVIYYNNSNGEEQSGIYPSYGTNYILDDVRNTPGTAQGRDGSAVREGEVIGAGTVLRPNNLWNINRTREGKLITEYGYKYKRIQIGLNDAKATIVKDEGFMEGKGNIYTIGRGDKEAKIFIVGQKVDFEENIFTDNKGDQSKYKERGFGYMPNDFPYTKAITDPNGKTCTVTFNTGIVYLRYYKDQGPKMRSGLIKTSMSSGGGTDQVYGTKGTSVAVTGNKTGDTENDLTLYSGQYEIFVYAHGDIGFMWINEPEATTGYQFAQYITLALS